MSRSAIRSDNATATRSSVPLLLILTLNSVCCHRLSSAVDVGEADGSDTDNDVDSDTDIGSDSDSDTEAIVAQQVSAGRFHTCVLLSTGAVRCFGDGFFGQLGYESTDDIGDDEVPASAGDVDLGDTAVQVTAGSDHTCVLMGTGVVRCWGSGFRGQLGYGNTDDIGDDESPASAGDVEVGGTVVQLAAGGFHTCALLDTGAVRCWGANGTGQLGYGNTDDIGDDETPAAAGDVNLGGIVLQVAAGEYHNCALMETGAVRCWGTGVVGQLGYGNEEDIGDDELPATAGDVPLGGEALLVTAGLGYSCAVLDTSAVRCWGAGLTGQLGYGNTEHIGDDEVPASVGDVEMGGAAVAADVGHGHTCVLLDTGAVRCWGYGLFGQLGTGGTEDIGDDELPVSVGEVEVGGTAVGITAGGRHTCVLMDTGEVRCFGSGESGQLGYGNTDSLGDEPGEMPPANVPVI